MSIIRYKGTDKLDISVFNNECKFAVIGFLDQGKVDFLIGKFPEFHNTLKQSPILLWEDRIKYTEKHKADFMKPEDFYMCMERIPEIIEEPDFIGINPKDSSLQFIKRFSQNILIAVRFNSDGKLSYRTLYPITDSQLCDYIRKKRAWEYRLDIRETIL